MVLPLLLLLRLPLLRVRSLLTSVVFLCHAARGCLLCHVSIVQCSLLSSLREVTGLLKMPIPALGAVSEGM